MKASEIKEMTSDEVAENLTEQVEMLSKLRMQHAVSPLENHNQFRMVKRVIARLKTEQRSRELNASKAEA
jgi:large subunit ribosomal protein L29